MAELEWVIVFEKSLHDYAFRHLEAPLAPEREPTVVSRREARVLDPPSQAVIDAKSLFDAVLSEQTLQEDRRNALEVAVSRESFAALGTRIRWAPHDKNPTDALTKGEHAHIVPLERLVMTGRLAIMCESRKLSKRQEVKKEMGYCPRPRRSTELGTL